MRGGMRNAVRGGQMFEPEARLAIGIGRPGDAIRPQCIGGAHHVQDIPAAATVLPFACVGIDQVAPEQKARYFVIKANRVVTDPDRAALRKRLLDCRGKLVFRHTFLNTGLGCDACNQACLWIR